MTLKMHLTISPHCFSHRIWLPTDERRSLGAPAASRSHLAGEREGPSLRPLCGGVHARLSSSSGRAAASVVAHACLPLTGPCAAAQHKRGVALALPAGRPAGALRVGVLAACMQPQLGISEQIAFWCDRAKQAGRVRPCRMLKNNAELAHPAGRAPNQQASLPIRPRCTPGGSPVGCGCISTMTGCSPGPATRPTWIHCGM